jgi:hypothetical protein
MATTTDDTQDTVAFEVDGKRSDPMPLNEFEDRANEAIDRLRGERGEQLSFDTGVGRKDKPDFASLKIAGALSGERDLRYMEHVTIRVTDRHGEMISEQSASIGYPVFKDHFDQYGAKTVERIHTAKIDD